MTAGSIQPATAGAPASGQPGLAGQVVRALVLGVAQDGLIRLALPSGQATVRSDLPLKPGTSVEVELRPAPGPPGGRPTLQTIIRGQAPAPAHAGTMQAAQSEAVAAAFPPSPEGRRAAAVATAMQAAAQRQGGLAPLIADLAQAVAAPQTPAAVRVAARPLLDSQAPLDRLPTGDSVRQALSRSGLFLEQRLAATPEAPPAGDLKAVLLVLRQALKTWSQALPPSANPPAEPAEARGPLPQGDPAAARGAAALPPPPYRGAATAAQAAAAATLAPETPAHAVAQRLARQTDAALSRNDLLQIASLPDPGAEAPTQPAARWMFEMPLSTPQGPAVAQFEVSRDGSAAGGGAPSPVWRARFSIDIEPLGPVHVQMAMSGERVGVGVWAERPDSLAALRREEGALARALTDGDRVAELAFHPGAPRRPAIAAGHLIDLAS